MRLSIVSLSFLLVFSKVSHAQILNEQFDAIIDNVESAFGINENQERILIHRFWDPNAQSDSAIRFPFLTRETPIITITGRIAKERTISEDAFAILVCHEFGHHLAKGPRIGLRNLENWSAAEGEADYWATSVCIKTYLRNQLNTPQRVMSHSPHLLDKSLETKCENNYVTPEAIAICYRTLDAIHSLADYFTDHNQSRIDFQSKAPPSSVLIRRFRLDNYRDQCRIETFLAGAFCQLRAESLFQCKNEDDMRPRCWFKE